MLALKIEDIKTFTAKLFLGEDFDGFLVREASIVTYNSFTIDGHVRSGFYTEEERTERGIGPLSSWKTLRPVCFFLIKGKKLPGSFSIAFELGQDKVREFLEKKELKTAPETIQGLCMNIRYEDGRLMVTTATSLGFFTLDKTIDMEWDGEVRRLLKEKEIDYTEQ